MIPIAFLSYTHFDDKHLQKKISKFHERLSGEICLQTGDDITIFMDRRNIKWGQSWKKRIDNSLDGASFLIPILTPGFFKSEACREEVKQFINREKDLGREDLILPVYYVSCDILENIERLKKDSIAQFIANHQYFDWRNLRFETDESPLLEKTYERLALHIVSALHDPHDSNPQDEQEARDAEIAESSLMNRKITYESLMDYASYMYPNYPPSHTWTKRLLQDIDLTKYHKISEIHDLVKFARSAVNKYADEVPHAFKWGTDFITKTLIFTDEGFRENHPVSQPTMVRAHQFNSN